MNITNSLMECLTLKPNINMLKPDYLYHGSPKKLEILKPSQAIGFSGAGDNENAVYAVARYELAVAFALSLTAQSASAIFSVDTQRNPPIIRLKDTVIDWQKTGYIYKLPSSAFQLIAQDQWVSYKAVIPIEIFKINPMDYKSWITLL